MNRNTHHLALCGIFALALLWGCGETRQLVDDPTISLSYLKEPSEENLGTLSKAYAQALNRNRKAQVKQPGLAAEYAITLALLGDQQQANQWFNREVADFPSSRTYVVKLKAIYCPAYSNDQTQASDAALESAAAPAGADNGLTGADAAVQQVLDEQQAALAGSQDQPQLKQKSSADKSKAKGKQGKKSKKKGKKPAKKAKKR